MYTVCHLRTGRPHKEIWVLVEGMGGVGRLKVAGRRHWNAREKGTIQRERRKHSPTNTVNKTSGTGDLNGRQKCSTIWHAGLPKKTITDKLYITMDLSSFSTKGQSQVCHLLVFEVVQLWFCWLRNGTVRTQPLWYVEINQGEARLQMHAYGGGGSCIPNAWTLSTHIALSRNVSA